METAFYQNSWHNIALGNLPGANSSLDAPAGAEFYTEIYAALETGSGNVDAAWRGEKLSLGREVAGQVFEPWEREHGRRPSILALCVGKAVAEEVWLAEGYQVTLHECQITSLKDVLGRHPNAPVLISDLRSLAIPGQFDIIVMLGGDYFLSKQELTDLIRTAAEKLTKDGILILWSTTVLSLKQGVKEFVKHLIGRHLSPSYVFWGWWRTVSEFSKFARPARLRLAESYSTDSPAGQTVMQRRSTICRACPTLHSTSALMVFTRH